MQLFQRCNRDKRDAATALISLSFSVHSRRQLFTKRFVLVSQATCLLSTRHYLSVYYFLAMKEEEMQLPFTVFCMKIFKTDDVQILQKCQVFFWFFNC